ncbi:MAG TPA: hypothetical protein VF719_03205, partial [Abditibacteriaceae bacterium]
GIAYLDQILDILACVEASDAAPFAILEPEIAENLAQINTVSCVFLDWDETRRAFLEQMQSSGASVKGIIVRDTDCTLNPHEDPHFSGVLSVVSRELFTSGIDAL